MCVIALSTIEIRNCIIEISKKDHKDNYLFKDIASALHLAPGRDRECSQHYHVSKFIKLDYSSSPFLNEIRHSQQTHGHKDRPIHHWLIELKFLWL